MGAHHDWEEEAGAEEEHRREEELAAREAEVEEVPRPGQAEGAKEPNARAEEGREEQREEGEEGEPPAEQSLTEEEVQAGPAEVSGVRGSEGLASGEPDARVELTEEVAEGGRSVVSASSRLVHEKAVLPEEASSVSLAVGEGVACSPVRVWEQPSGSQSPAVSFAEWLATHLFDTALLLDELLNEVLVVLDVLFAESAHAELLKQHLPAGVDP